MLLSFSGLTTFMLFSWSKNIAFKLKIIAKQFRSKCSQSAETFFHFHFTFSFRCQGLVMFSPDDSFMSSSAFVQPLVHEAEPRLLKSHFLPPMEKLKKRAESVLREEERMKTEGCSDLAEAELALQGKFTVMVQDLYAFYPLLIPFVDHHR